MFFAGILMLLGHWNRGYHGLDV